jgi:cell wall-associated NlpC family hydrolase
MKKITKLAIVALAFTSFLFVSATVSSNQHVSDAATRHEFKRVRRVAQSKLGAQYVYGATGSHVFDCSSFTQYVYRRSLGVQLPRTAQEQFYASRHVSHKHVKRGDLVFFGTSKYDIDHVGLYVGHGQMIDAQLRGVITEQVHAPWWHAVAYGRVA